MLNVGARPFAGLVSLGALLWLAQGCAAKPRPTVTSPAQLSVQKSVRLAWLPVEEHLFAELGPEVNHRLESAKPEGVDVTFMAPVSMEVAQLSLECIQQTIPCYLEVGKMLAANRLLWASIAPVGKRSGMKITLVLFDVDRAQVVRRSEETFAGGEAARIGLDDLVTSTLGYTRIAGHSSSPPPEEPAP